MCAARDGFTFQNGRGHIVCLCVLCVLHPPINSPLLVCSCSYYGSSRGLLCVQEWDLQAHGRQLHQALAVPQAWHTLSQDHWVR